MRAGDRTEGRGAPGRRRTIAAMKIALVQQHPAADKSDHIRRRLEGVGHPAKAGADVIAFAELAFERFHPQRPADGDPLRLAQAVPGPMTEALAERARRHGVVIVLNLYERDGRQAYDCSPVIDADGRL